jgi:DNA-binding response OmpR family regulator
MRILLAEDDSRVASFIKRGLTEEHFTVDVAADGDKALYLAQIGEYDVVILDIMLPKKSGMEILQAIRGEKIMTPVLFLTARDKLSDKVAGLNAGADDYLVKPFSFEELLARVRALLRRPTSGFASPLLKAADLELDTLKHRAKRAGRDLNLTNREYALLEFFMRRANQVVTRAMLSEHVWEHDFDTFSNVIDVHVGRLRRKIDGDFKIKLLKTVRGSGYILDIPKHA